MTAPPERGSTRNSRLIRAPREAVYRAFTHPEALSQWLAPERMSGVVQRFDQRVGGGYWMSLHLEDS